MVVANPQLEQTLRAGQVQYHEFNGRGGCWADVVKEMQQECVELNEETQAVFAMQLTNCHLAKSGLQGYPCNRNMSAYQCTKDLDTKAWISYNEFYTHAFHICVFLSHRVWQDQTQATIQGLTTASAETQLTLLESLKTTQSIQASQTEIDRNMQRTLTQHQDLQRQLVNNKQDLSAFAQEFRSSTQQMSQDLKQQHEKVLSWVSGIYQGIDDVRRIQEIVLGEMWDLKTLIFYCSCVVIVLYLTASNQACTARGLLLRHLMLLFLIERAMDSPSWALNWSLRLAYVLHSAWALAKQMQQYKPYDKLNHDLLLDLVESFRHKTVAYFSPHPDSNEAKPKFVAFTKRPETRESIDRDNDWCVSRLRF